MGNKPRTGINKNCLTCNKEFYVKKHRIDTAKYCSMKCLGIGTTIKVIRKCNICDKEFSIIESRCKKAKYCSQACYKKALSLKGTKQYFCSHCGKEFWSYRHTGRKYCSKKCTGKSYHKIFNPSFTTVRKTMLIRGLIKICNRCGYDKEPLILGVHHRDRNRKNNTLENLEVLCPNCHSLEHLKHIVVHS